MILAKTKFSAGQIVMLHGKVVVKMVFKFVAAQTMMQDV
jgi:hypothetical protein